MSPLKLKAYQERFVRDKLRRFVEGGLDWSVLNIGLFADMGTGKTPAAILLLEWLRHFLQQRGLQEGNLPALLIVPAAVKWNWQAEINRFAPWVKEKDILIISGARKKREKQLAQVLEEKPRFVITNYDIVRVHRQWFQDHPGFLMVLVDEAHAIKNRKAQRTVAIKAVDTLCNIALTGTPITNKPDDLWSILHFIDPGEPYLRKVWRGKKENRKAETIRYRAASPEWGSYYSFCERYCEWERNRFGARIVGGKNLSELNDRLVDTQVMTRWRRSEVLSLDPIIYKYITLRPTLEQAQIYQQLAKGYVAYVRELGSLDWKQIRGVLAQLTYFRRATTLTPREFALATGDHGPDFAPDLQIPVSDKGAKQEWLLHFLKNDLDNNEKVLIFSDWTDCTRPLAQRLERNRIESVSIDGSTPHKKRYDIQERFNADHSVRVLIGSPAAYEGLNLQAATYVVFMNLPWRPKDIFQAYSRCHRLGQEGQVTVIFPMVGGTIDIQMAKQLHKKQEDIDLAIDRGEVNAAKLFQLRTTDQILGMIGGGYEAD